MSEQVIFGEATDSFVCGQDAIYATARSTAHEFDTNGYLIVGQALDKGLYNCWRSVLEFDTSGVTGTVTAVQLKLTVSSDFSTLDFTVRINKCAWDSPFDAGNMEANYDAVLAGTYDDMWRSSSGVLPDTPYLSAQLDPTYVNLEGMTQYGLISSMDQQGIPPPTNSFLLLYPQESATEAFRPQLILTVSEDGGIQPQLLGQHVVGGRRYASDHGPIYHFGEE